MNLEENIHWEDNLLENKLESDLKDLLKTMVAFSNSVVPGHKAVINIGIDDQGEIKGVTNPDQIQKNIRKEADKIYPSIVWRSQVIENQKTAFVRVEIEYSGNAPHFGGPAWVRKGSETVKASDEVFQKLIDLRTDIIFELNKWLGKRVTILGNIHSIPSPRDVNLEVPRLISQHRLPLSEQEAELVAANRYWIRFYIISQGIYYVEPIKKLTLTFDQKHERLQIIVDF